MNREVICFDAVAPVRERGLKFLVPALKIRSTTVAPVRERGLKSYPAMLHERLYGRSREGAWIEIVSAAV